MSIIKSRDDFKPRVIDNLIETYLTVSGTICIEGLSGVAKLGRLRFIVIVNF